MTMDIGPLMTDLVRAMAKEHPVVLVFVLALFGGSMVYSIRVFAEKDVVDARFTGVEQRIDSLDSKVDSLENKVDSLENKVDLRHMETQLYSLDAEIYQLERLVGDEKANDRDHARLSNLQTQRKNVTRDIGKLGDKK